MISLSWAESFLSISPIQNLMLVSTSLETTWPGLTDLVEELLEVVLGPLLLLLGLRPGGGDDLIEQAGGFGRLGGRRCRGRCLFGAAHHLVSVLGSAASMPSSLARAMAFSVLLSTSASSCSSLSLPSILLSSWVSRCRMSSSSLRRGHLLGDVGRLEVVDVLEVQLDGQLGVLVGQLVLDLHGHPRRRLGQHVVEVVAVDVDELALLERLERLLGLRRQVGHDADDERQFDLLHRAVGFDVVGDLHARPAHAVQLVL